MDKFKRVFSSWMVGSLLFLVIAASCRQSPAQTSATPIESEGESATVLSTPEPSEMDTPTIVPTHTSVPVQLAGVDSSEPEAPATEADAAARQLSSDNDIYLPVVGSDLQVVTPSPPASGTPTPIPTLDFAALQERLESEGLQLGYNKIGFHVGVGGNRHGITDWMRRLDEAGVPFFLKSVSDAGLLAEAQEMIRASGVDHTLVFRVSGDQYDVPDYNLPPAEAARLHWDLHVKAWPPELDRNLVWIETINEVDKNRSEWLGQFAIETAALAQRDGFRWAAFGWSSGEPEVEHWETPSMLEFLALAASRPDRLAIALHEYSYDVDDIGDAYPYKVGRFQQLFQVCDRAGIARPTVLITEWGWEYANNPQPAQAINDVAWAARMYASYPEIRGAAIWYLGPGFADISNQTQRLIEPVMIYSLTNYFAIDPNAVSALVQPETHAP